MNKVYDLLKENNIKMSLLIYPWPQQLKNKDLNSKHVEMWNKFCIDKCENFINLFSFLKKNLKIVILLMYIKNIFIGTMFILTKRKSIRSK